MAKLRVIPPSKPRPDFPLFAHGASGQWRKDIWQAGADGRKRAVPYYFGSWADDPKGERALKQWVRRKDAIYAGLDHLQAQAEQDELTLGEMVRRFMAVKNQKLLEGELSDETFNDYVVELQLFVDLVGAYSQAKAISAGHFSAYAKHLRDGPSSQDPTARNLGPHRLGNVIRYIKACFNYAVQQGWIPKPLYGADFVAPPTDPESLAIRKIRRGENADLEPIFTPRMIRWLLKNSKPAYRGMILLSLNCGMGPSDLAKLQWDQIDFATGRLACRRGKNGRRRECYLWRKTRKALLALPRKPELGPLVFYRSNGRPYVWRQRIMEDGRVKKVKVHNRISYPFCRTIKRARKAGIVPEKLKLTYYNLRHTYYSIAEDCGDLNAVNRTMGHGLYGQGRRYKRKRFPVRRLRRVAKYVFRKLFGPRKVKARPGTAQSEAGLADGGGEQPAQAA